MVGISKTNVVIRALPPYVTMSVGNQYNNVRRAQQGSGHPKLMFGWCSCQFRLGENRNIKLARRNTFKTEYIGLQEIDHNLSS
jgi:hypothetical protein